MTTRRELCLEEKINLIKEKENGLSYRQLSDKFQILVGVVSNISKRKLEYTDDYELNRNKKLKGKFKNELNQDINSRL
ncbi:unnamed protein product [Rotaria sp. Silwood2]|nr:unnamed protein product [Rotaria sp. Silwood2]CAF4655633.1 unnamed protein product [Rotaria sp. Silwood2]